MTTERIPFNRPHVIGTEFDHIQAAIENLHLSGNGAYTQRCQQWLVEHVGIQAALLTHSCTAALEMAAILAEIGPGDEVIMPSYTFVSTANAFVLRGGVPVFVDVRPDTFNLDEQQIEAAITPRTKAIVPVHYAGVSCEMDAIMDVARRHNLIVIEDAAQGLLSAYRQRPVGSLGHMAAVSFHETKNVISGEGGALLLNDERFVERAEVIWEKGTNRRQFFRGMVDKYTWVDVGSSFLPSEITAAFLWPQLQHAARITQERLALWSHYHTAFAPLEQHGIVRRPHIPDDCAHNAHMYYVLTRDASDRKHLIDSLNKQEINAVFHYVALHSAPAGRLFARTHGSMINTDVASERLMRLPLWVGMRPDQVDRVVEAVASVMRVHAV